MKNKNEIGLVLKERLKDLNDSPDPVVWTHIEEKLKKKKQHYKRYIFILLGLLTLALLYIVLKLNTINNVDTSAVDLCDSEIIYTGPIIKNKTQESNPIKKATIKELIPQKNKQKVYFKTTTKVNLNRPLASTIKLQNNNLYIKTNNKFDSLYFSLPKKRQTKKETLKERLSVTLNGGLNYLGSYSEGNSFNSSLVNNKTSNRLSYNIGFYLNYKLSNKLHFRIGAHHLKLNYTTNNIQINGSEAQLYSINSIIGIDSDYAGMDILSLFNNDEFIELTESSTYIEVPLEFTYIFQESKKNKFGFILGYSQLFLDKTEVLGASTNTPEFLIGSSNRVNNTKFSLNLGATSTIKLQKYLMLNLELNCKNYFGRYTTNSIDLSPFVINFQTGITYDF